MEKIKHRSQSKSIGYKNSYYYLEKDRKKAETIILEPTQVKLDDYKSNLPYYNEYTKEDIKRDFPDSLLYKIDTSAMFPGGIPQLHKYLQTHIKYPQTAFDLNVEGKVFIRFIVGIDGSISTIHILKSVNQPMDEEAFKIIESMPKWSPAIYNGQPVKSLYILPVSYQLQ